MRLRAPVPDDAPAVLAVLAARDVADFGIADDALEDVLGEWRGGDLDLAEDVRVVETGSGAIVGYAVVRRPGSFAVVHPRHEGQGIGTRLLEWAERRERERGRVSHRQLVAADNARARTLLTGAGYVIARGHWRMARSLDDLRATAPPPAGVGLRTVDVARDAGGRTRRSALSTSWRSIQIIRVAVSAPRCSKVRSWRSRPRGCARRSSTSAPTISGR